MDWFGLNMSLDMMDGNFFMLLGAIIVLAIIIGVGYGFYELHMYIRDKKIKNGKQPNCLNGSWKREKFPEDTKYTIVEDDDGKRECIKWSDIIRRNQLVKENIIREEEGEGEDGDGGKYKIVNSRKLAFIIVPILPTLGIIYIIIKALILKSDGSELAIL